MLARRPPQPDPADVALARLTAAVDQVLAAIDTTLRANRANRQLTDILLDLRNILAPPRGST